MPLYTASGEPYDAERPLVRAAGADFLSTGMMEVLLQAGADPNATASGGLGGSRPLHLACDGMLPLGMDEGSAEEAVAEVDGAVAALLAHGADPAALDEEGRTAGERYRAWIDGLVGDGLLTRGRADELIVHHAADLGIALA